MPLSEHEQRILDEIERRLVNEDPAFARSADQSTPRGVALSRVKRAAITFVLGLLLLVGGLFAGLDNANMLVAFGLAGFVVMVVSVVLAVKATKDLTPISVGKPSPPGWFKGTEERWRKRFERGDR